jgi:hypothetical protein
VARLAPIQGTGSAADIAAAAWDVTGILDRGAV